MTKAVLLSLFLSVSPLAAENSMALKDKSSAHGTSPSSLRAEGNATNSVLKSTKFILTDLSDLEVGNSATPEGRKALASYLAGKQGYAADNLLPIMGVLREFSKHLDRPAGASFVELPMHTFANEVCAAAPLSLKPLTSKEAIEKFYPELVREGKISLEELLKTVLKKQGIDKLDFVVTAAENDYSFRVEVGAYNQAGQKLFSDSFDKKYLATGYSSAAAFSLLNVAQDRKLLSYSDDAQQRTTGMAMILVNDIVASLLLKSQEKEVAKLIKQKNEECENKLEAARVQKAAEFENILTDLLNSLGTINK